MANPALPTIQDVANELQGSLRGSLDPQGLGLVDLEPGSDLSALVSMLAQGTARVTEYVADRLAARDPSNAIGTDLDDLAQQRFQTSRKPATSAFTTVYLQRTGTAQTYIPSGNRFGVQAADNQPGVSFGANATVLVGSGVLKIAVPVTCTVVGSVGNVTLPAITQILDALPDNTWQLYVPITGDSILNGATLPDTVGGGADLESDAQLQARLNQLTPNAQPGTPAGIVFGALEYLGIVFVDVVEPGDGTVLVYAGDVNYQLPAQLSTGLLSALQSWRALGSVVLVRPYNVQTVTVTANAFMATPIKNYNQAALQALAIANVIYYFTTQRPRSDEYFMSAIQAAIFKVEDNIQSVTLSLPASDQLRPADSSYGTITALNRYVVTPQSVSVSFFDPQHS